MSEAHADVLIIGAGASGGVAALRLIEAGMSVVCLEQGHWVDRIEFRGAELDYELTGLKHWSCDPNVRRRPEDYFIDGTESDLGAYNFNGVGGGTILYAALWPRLLPSNFRSRSLVGIADDWPISYEELLPYYEATDVQVGVSGLAGNPAYPPGADPPMPPLPLGTIGMKVARAHARLGWHWWPDSNAIASVPYRGRNRCVQRGACLRGCGEGAKSTIDQTHWKAVVAQGGRVITGARVRRIILDGRGLARGAEWIDEAGNCHRQSSDVTICAANGIGTPRLLLASADSRFRDGLANSSGLVGRRLMMHPTMLVTGYFDENAETWQGQKGSSVGSLEFYESDESRGFVLGSKWALHPTGGPLDEALAAGVWGSNHHETLRRRLGRSALWSLHCEDLPDPENRIELTKATDSSGLELPKLVYRIDENARAMMTWHAARAKDAFSEAGAIATEEFFLPYNAHFMGTARMGDDPRTSVVDRWCVTHDVPNLIVIDGSVFVTAGGVNPTSTICALALRAADHLVSARGNMPRPDQERSWLMSPSKSILKSVIEPINGHAFSPLERARLVRFADYLIPPSSSMPAPSEVGIAEDLLDQVVAARPDLIDNLIKVLSRDVLEIGPELERLRESDAELFQTLAVVVAGGFYMSSQVRELIGYNGQLARPVRIEGLPDYVAEGLLDHMLG